MSDPSVWLVALCLAVACVILVTLADDDTPI